VNAPAPLTARFARWTKTDLPADIHASAIVLGECGVLITGAPGAGKSHLAHALIQAARQAGIFAALIGDDRIHLCEVHGRLLARGHPRISGRMELRDLGIVDAPGLAAGLVCAWIELRDCDQVPRLPLQEAEETAEASAGLHRLMLPSKAVHAPAIAAELVRLSQSWRLKLETSHVNHSLI